MDRKRKAIALTFNVISDPFRDDPEGADAFYAAAGRYVRLWGQFEMHFDHTLLVIAVLPALSEYRRLIQTTLGWQMRQKLRLWRNLFADVEMFAPIRQRALALYEDALAANESRNVVLHSSWQEFTNNDPLTMRAVQYNHRQDHIHASEFFISLTKLNLLADGAGELNTRLVPIDFFVHSLFKRQTAE